MSTRNSLLWLLIGVLAIGISICTLTVMVESLDDAAAAVPIIDAAPKADAALTNCSKGASGRQAWSVCWSSTSYAPYTTQQVIVADCVRPWWAGGGSYQAVGSWVPKGWTSTLYCASYYEAKNPRIWFR